MTVDAGLLAILVCPLTRAPLIADADGQRLLSPAAGLAYPVHNSVPVMLADEADAWEAASASADNRL